MANAVVEDGGCQAQRGTTTADWITNLLSKMLSTSLPITGWMENMDAMDTVVQDKRRESGVAIPS